VGVVAGQALLDLCYEEDSSADTDMNVVLTGDGTFVEVQGTAEKTAFDRATLDALLDLAVSGCAELATLQRTALAAPLPRPGPGAAHGSGPRGAGATAL
jgi:ribonuclease PH